MNANPSTAVPPPRRRWLARIGIPILILLAVLSLFAYTFRSILAGRTPVWVVPVVAREGAAPAAAGNVITQAPGWIEPSPYPVQVPAFTEGVIREVLCLEGDRVEASQVVARLDDRDARLILERLEADLDSHRAQLKRAEAAVNSAILRTEEIADELSRKERVVSIGGVSEGEFTRLRIRARIADQDLAETRASLASLQAATRAHQVRRDEAALALERTEIRSPTSGIVLSRHVEPGTRIHFADPSGADHPMGAVVRIYDPKKLQVRVDVPLADAAKVSLGAIAQITTEALPDTTFSGKVILIGQQADIQRNTVPVKVAVDNPSPILKPEMLARVRITSAAAGSTTTSPSTRLLVQEDALLNRTGDKAFAWLVGQGNKAEYRELRILGASADNHIPVSGVNPGDRLIIDSPPSLREGDRVDVRGEHQGTSP